MSPAAFVGAVVGGLIGAFVWAAIGYFTGYEVGYVAWGVGILVGYASKALGGSGQANGIACAAIAVAAILAGKGLAIHFSRPGQIDELTQALYEARSREARSFAKIASKDAYPAFMVEHGYTDADRAEDVTEEEIDFFVEVEVPVLEKLNAGMTLDEFRDTEQVRAFASVLAPSGSLVESVKESLTLIDIIFALLGIGTAFRVGGAERKLKWEPVAEGDEAASGS